MHGTLISGEDFSNHNYHTNRIHILRSIFSQGGFFQSQLLNQAEEALESKEKSLIIFNKTIDRFVLGTLLANNRMH